MDSCAMATVFRLSVQRGSMEISLSDVIEFLARDAWLNDIVLVFAFKQMAADYDGVFVADSLRPSRKQPAAKPPTVKLQTLRGIVFPVCVGKHWYLIYISIYAPGKARVFMYDPLMTPTFQDKLTREWKRFYEPLVTEWAKRDDFFVTGTSVTDQLPRQWVTSPRQADGNNSAVFCFAVALDFAGGTNDFTSTPTISLRTLRELRIRILWRIVRGSVRVDRSEEEDNAAMQIASFNAFAMDAALVKPKAARYKQKTKAKRK